MMDRRLNALTRFIAMVLVVIYAIVGILLLRNKLVVNQQRVEASESTIENAEMINTKDEVEPVKEEVNKENHDIALEEKNDENNDGVKNDDSLDDKKQEATKDEEETANKSDVEEEVFTDAPEGYFKDALFIGDSRTVGLRDYGGLTDATFFASEGMSVYNIEKEKISVPKMGSVSLDSILSKKQYGKIYVMIGINELGYEFNKTVGKYTDLVEKIRKAQPSAIVYVQANLHVSGSRSKSDKIFNNTNINKYNKAIEKLADNQNVFYIDVNPLFDDKKGNLASEYTSDSTHVLGKYYQTWIEWIATKAIVK